MATKRKELFYAVNSEKNRVYVADLEKKLNGLERVSEDEAKELIYQKGTLDKFPKIVYEGLHKLYIDLSRIDPDDGKELSDSIELLERYRRTMVKVVWFKATDSAFQPIIYGE